MANLFLRLREQQTAALSGRTVTLTDTTAYEILSPGWQPVVAQLNAQGSYGPVLESIQIRVTGATPDAVYTNLRALTSLLTQVQRWSNHEQVYPVVMDYTPFGGVKRLSSKILGWDPTGYLPENYNHTIITTNKVDVTVNLARDGLLYHTSWAYENLLTASAWIAAPSFLFTASAGTYTPSSTPADVHGSQRMTKSAGLAATMVLDTPTLSGTSGVAMTVRFTATASAGISQHEIWLVDAGTALASNYVTMTGSGNFTVTLTPTTTGTLRLLWNVYGTAASTFDVKKVMVCSGVVATVDMTWHRTYSEHVVAPATTTAANPSIHTATLPTPAGEMSPLTARIGGGLSLARNPTMAAGIALISGPASDAILLFGLPEANTKVAAPFSAVADTANNAYLGQVTRYTPAGTTKISCHTAPERFLITQSNIPGEMAGFVVVRNNSATTTFAISLRLSDRGGNTAETPPVWIAGSGSPVPQLIPLGSLFSEDGFSHWELMVQASAASGTFDINYVGFQNTIPGAQAVALDAILPLSSGAAQYMTLDPAPLTHRQARYAIGASATLPAAQSKAGYRGALRHLCSRGDAGVAGDPEQVKCLWMATYSTSWVHVDAGVSMATVTSTSLLCTRLPAYIVPE